jgi:hypothetical protein
MTEANKKFILDATAGFRMMWFNKHDPNTLYIDKRPEVEPDQVADWTKTLPYPNESFKLIIFDPPHIIKNSGIGNFDSNNIRTYGILQADTVAIDIKNAFSEFWRLLQPYGILLFKWNTTSTSSDELIKLAPCPPLIYQISASNQIVNKKTGKKTNQNSMVLFYEETAKGEL